MSPRSVLLIPPNDPEAVAIYRIAKALGLPVIRSPQPHGATLEEEPDIVALIKEGGWKRVIIVEIPGPKTEEKIRKLGVKLVIIDHHRYANLDRAHDAKGKLLLSSMEQFLALFKLTPAKLRALGFEPRLIKGIALMDRGFVWALMDAGYSKAEIRKVTDYQMELMGSVRDLSGEMEKRKIVEAAWKKRKKWKGFLVIEDGHDIGIRAGISFLIALNIGKPTPVIMAEKQRGFIYVQESDHAIRLFKEFGGFTFGLDRCWGYKNGGRAKKVTLAAIKKAIESWS